MNRLVCLIGCASLVGIPLSAQRGTPAKATVEGDIYLLMKSGDTKKGAGRTIYLLRTDRGLETALATSCSISAEDVARIEAKIERLKRLMTTIPPTLPDGRSNIDTLGRLQVFQDGAKLDHLKILADFVNSIASEIEFAKVDSAGSGMNAHYRFSGVNPGRYVLSSQWMIGDNRYEWWVVTEVKAGEQKFRDLDNAVEGDAFRARCGKRGK